MFILKLVYELHYELGMDSLYINAHKCMEKVIYYNAVMDILLIFTNKGVKNICGVD